MSRVLTALEVANRLRVSVDTIYRAVRNGRLPCRRLTQRGKILFDEAQLAQALEADHPVRETAQTAA